METKNQKLAQVKKSVGVTAKVLKIFRNILIAGAILAAISAIICFVMHEKIDVELGKAVAEGKGTASFDDIEFGGLLRVDASIQKIADQGYYGYALGAVCCFAAAICAVLAILFKALGKVFILIEQSETPFNANIMKQLKKSFIVLVVVIAVFFEPSIAVVVALTLWSVYSIIDYGCVLQQQEDETL